MPACKFYLQGNCRYGNKCWNDHPSGGNQGYSLTAQRQLFGGGQRGGQNQNPYKWTAQDAHASQPPAQAATLSPADIVNGLGNEVKVTWEGGNMWPFSCLGFEKEMPSLPGFTDISPEEMRNDAYEAIKQGSIAPYLQKVEAAFQELNTQRQELKNPSMSVKQKLISFIDNCYRKKTSSGSGLGSSLFCDSGGGGTDLFGKPSTPASTGLFGQAQGSQSLFGQSSTFGSQPASSGFGSQQSSFDQSGNQSNAFKTTGAFGSANPQSNAFGTLGSQSFSGQSSAFGQSGSQSLFGQSSSPQTGFGASSGNSLFGQSNQSTGFGQASFNQSAQQTTGLFGKPVQEVSAAGGKSAGLFGSQGGGTGFGSAGTGFGSSSSPFGQSNSTVGSSIGSTTQPAGTFGSSSTAATSGQSSTSNIPSTYTPMDKLTAEEIEQFKAQTFTIGKIPTKPPPKELCF